MVYFAPKNSTSSHSNENVLDIISHELTDFLADPSIVSTVICGDFNARTGCLSEERQPLIIDSDIIDCGLSRESKTSKDNTVDARGRELLNFCSLHDFTIANGRCGLDRGIGEFTCVTHNGASVVDYLLFRPGLSLESFEILDKSSSDHFPLQFTLSTADYCFESGSTYVDCNDFTTSHVIPRFRWSDDLADEYNRILSSDEFTNVFSDLQSLCHENRVDESVARITSAVTYCAHKMKTVIKNTSHGPRTKNTWFDSECRQLKSAARSHLRCFRIVNSRENLLKYLKSKRDYRNLIKRKKLAFKRAKTAALKSALHSDSRVFWNFFRSSRAQPSHLIPAHCWSSHFRSLYQELYSDSQLPRFQGDTSGDSSTLITTQHEIEILDHEITREEVEFVLSKQNNNKAPGIDGIPIEYWKNFVPFIDIITEMFNMFFSSGSYPESWKSAIITPVPKKGDLAEPSSYRGISILPSLSKVYAGVLNKRFIRWADVFSFFTDSQQGFRIGRSTLDNIFIINTVVRSHHLKPKPRNVVYCAFVDLFKAFDSVPRHLLFHKQGKIFFG